MTSSHRLLKKDPDGRLISIATTSSTNSTGNSTRFQPNGTWSAEYKDEYPPTTSDAKCTSMPADKAVEYCGGYCLNSSGCEYFWVYTLGKKQTNPLSNRESARGHWWIASPPLRQSISALSMR